MTYAATLTEAQRHLTRRLEGFGDVVIGFSLSQLALQLVLPNSPADLAHPIRFVIYFASFAALVGLWFSYHRMLSGAFAPTRIDLALLFIYLAFVSVVPFALYANVHFTTHLEWVRAGIGVYIVCFLGTSATSAAVAWRNFRRGWHYSTDEERAMLWRRVLTVTCVSVMLAVALVVDVAVPVDLLFGIVPPGAFVLAFMAVAIRVVLAAFGRRPPSPDRLRIPAEAPAG